MLDEIEPDVQEAVDRIEHFCFLPGIVNADKVIVQSEKMQDVFKLSKENKEDIALRWRPHPLIKNTIKSMRPKLWYSGYG